MRRWLLPALLLAAFPARADMFQNAGNALLPDALSKLTSLGLHGDLAAHPAWTDARCFQTYRGDVVRPWCVATANDIGFGYGKQVTGSSVSPDRPLLTIQRDQSRTVADSGTGEIGALRIVHNLTNTVPLNLFETGQIIQITSSTAAQTTARSVVGLHINAIRSVDNKDTIFGMNIQAQDQSGVANTALINSELDMQAGGPDSNKRVGIDLISKKIDTYAGTDTSFFAMLRIRTGAGPMGDTKSPSSILNGILIDPGDSGNMQTGINVVAGYSGLDPFGLDRAGKDGVLVQGTVVPTTGSHIRALGDTFGVLTIGGLNNVAGNTIGQVKYDGRNSSNARVTYGRTIAVIGDATPGAEVGAVQMQASIAGSLTPLFTVSGGASHVSVLDATDAASTTNAALIVTGGVAIGKSLYIGALPTTGTATATLCITSTGKVFAKTTTGACL